jgi:hypothetical protein
MPAWEDLNDFLRADDFAISAVFTLPGGQVLPAVLGIFDDPYLNAQLGEYEVDTTSPRFTGKLSDLRLVVRKSLAAITIDGVTSQFDVLTDVQPDGTGMAVVRMAPIA